jgi:hypothetical protein
MMPVVVPVMMPTNLGGLYLGTLLYRRGGAGIGQRHRLGMLGRSGQDEQSAHCGKSQKSRHVHVYSPLGSSCITPATLLDRIKPGGSADRKLSRRRECEVKIRATEMHARHTPRFPLLTTTFYEADGEHRSG